MKLLIDTHAFLWAIHGDARLSIAAEKPIWIAATICFSVPTSIWEIVIKVSLAKLEMVSGWVDTIRHEMDVSGVRLLPIEPDHGPQGWPATPGPSRTLLWAHPEFVNATLARPR